MKRSGVIIEAKGLEKVYNPGQPGEVRALDGVTLEVKAGEMLAIMGASGSGKSTLLHVLGTLDTPTAGTVSLNGVDLFDLSGRERTRIRAREIGMIFQHYNLIPTLSALENVELPLVYSGMGRRERRAKAQETLGALGLSDRLSHRPSELSGGQQQRVAVARALVADPAVIMADEPTGELDSKSSKEMMDLLTKLSEEQGQTFVLVTHNPVVARACDRTIEMRDGKVVRKK